MYVPNRAFCGAERTHRKTHIIVYKIASIYGVCLFERRLFDDAGKYQRVLKGNNMYICIVENYLRLALAGLESHLGRVHPDLLESMEGLGNVLYTNKRFQTGVLQECIELFQRALTLREQIFGKSDKGRLCVWCDVFFHKHLLYMS